MEMWNNFLKKVPTLLIIIVLLLAISLRQEKIFGHAFKPFSKTEQPAKSPAEKSILPEDFPLDSLATLLPGAVSITPLNGVWNQVENSHGQVVGYLLSSLNFAKTSTGYAGPTPVAIITDDAYLIHKVILLGNVESPGFVQHVKKTGFFDTWNEMTLSQARTTPVNAVSGATMTSSSVLNNLALALADAETNIPAELDYIPGKDPSTQGTSFDWLALLKWICVIAVVVLSLLSYFSPAKYKTWRVPLLIASVLVIGIWQGAFVSLSLLYGWLINGVTLSGRLSIIAIVLLAFLLPMLRNKPFYCIYLCPFGAAQELAGKLSKFKINIPQKLLVGLMKVRKYYLFAIVALLIIGINIELTDLEPFTIFMINSATVAVLIIAGVSLVGSVFVPKMWCRFFCPTGALLARFSGSGTKKKKQAKK